MRRRNLFMGAIFVSLFAGTVLADTSYETAAYGGSGGTFFEQECNYHFLKGFGLRHARVIDKVYTRCPNEGNTRVITSNIGYGGNGGTYDNTTCKSGYVVKGIRGRSARLVDRMQLTCVEEADVKNVNDPSNQTIDNNYPVFGGTGGSYFSIACGHGDAAVGMFGRSGSKVGKIGLICRDTGY